MHDTPLRNASVCVIGAGGSGLAAIKNLREHGFAVDCYERETSVGGGWNWRHDRSPITAGTYLVSSRPLTEFPDFPMPDDWPDYPHHSAFRSYLERYAAHFGLTEHIWFGTEVVAVVPAPDGGWDVTTRGTGGGAERTQRYAAVVAANGRLGEPVMPDVPGEFRGRMMHASAFKDPSVLRGRSVLVIGGGDSGCAIACEAAAQAETVWHATRGGYRYVPKYVLGRPIDQAYALALHRRVPAALRRWLLGRLLALTTGAAAYIPIKAEKSEMSGKGLGRGGNGAWTGKQPVVNGQLADHLAHGRIRPVAAVAALDGAEVELADGTRIAPDLIVAATGYRPRFDFVAPELLGDDLHLQIFTRRHPTLAVVGRIRPDAGLLPLAHWQSVAVARWLRLRVTDPARAAAIRRPEFDAGPDGEVGFTAYLTALDGLLTELEPA